MEREIKFRVYDTINKHMHCKETFINSEGTFFASADPNGINMSGVKSIRFNNQYVFAGQYTGLKDKNGKEIYECDIVTDIWNETIAEIIFERCWFKLKGKSGKFKSELLGNFVSSNIEIIGNIYETPNKE